MFWNQFYQLCRDAGKSPTEVVEQLGIARGSVTKWKGGALPSGKNLSKIADYFNVPVDRLFSSEQKEKPAEDDGLGENIVRFLGRDGKVLEKKLTPELLAYLESIPDSDDRL